MKPSNDNTEYQSIELITLPKSLPTELNYQKTIEQLQPIDKIAGFVGSFSLMYLFISPILLYCAVITLPVFLISLAVNIIPVCISQYTSNKIEKLKNKIQELQSKDKFKTLIDKNLLNTKNLEPDEQQTSKNFVYKKFINQEKVLVDKEFIDEESESSHNDTNPLDKRSENESMLSYASVFSGLSEESESSHNDTNPLDKRSENESMLSGASGFSGFSDDSNN